MDQYNREQTGSHSQRLLQLSAQQRSRTPRETKLDQTNIPAEVRRSVQQVRKLQTDIDNLADIQNNRHDPQRQTNVLSKPQRLLQT